MSYLLRKIAFDKYAAEGDNKNGESKDKPGTPSKGTWDTVKDKASDVWGTVKGYAKGVGEDALKGLEAAGKHIKDNKYAYSGGAIGAVAGVPVGLGIAEMTGMSATEKVLTTILSSAALAGTGAYIGHKSASYKQAGEAEGRAGWESTKKFFGGVGDHLSRNKGKYIGGAIGAAAAVPVGAAISESFGMRPTEKLITMIATGLATTGSGVAIGHYMDTKR